MANYVYSGGGSGSGTTLPSQAGHAGEFLTTDGVTLSWAPVGAGTIGGTAAAGQVAFGSGVNTITHSVDFTYDTVNNILATGNPALSYAGIGVNVNVFQLGAPAGRLPMLVWEADDVTINLPFVGFPQNVAGLMTTDNIAGTSIGGMVFTGFTDAAQNGSIIKFNGFFSNPAATAPAYTFELPLIWNGVTYVDPGATAINVRFESTNVLTHTDFRANGDWLMRSNVSIDKGLSFTGTVVIDPTKNQIGISDAGPNPLFIITKNGAVAGDAGKSFTTILGEGAAGDAVVPGAVGGSWSVSIGTGGNASALQIGGTGGTGAIFGGTGGQGSAAQVSGDGGALTFLGGTPGIDNGGGSGVYGNVLIGSSGSQTSYTPIGISNSIIDNLANAYRISEGANNYLRIVTTNGSESIVFGNAVTNPTYQFLGSNVASARTSLGIQSGTSTLVAGTVTIVATITASSRIVVSIKDANPGAGGLTVGLEVPNATRVVGAPGSFDVQANVAAGTINVLDTSTFDWVVIG